jgi:hypothetical protein
MKAKVLLVLALLFLFFYEAEAQILSDDFNGTSINTNLWTIYNTPAGNSSVTEASGNATFINGAGLLTVSNFAAATVSGSFEFVGDNDDRFSIYFRSDGKTFDPTYQDLLSGIMVQFSPSSNPSGIDSLWIANATTDPYTVLQQATPTISMNTYYNYVITDSGNKITVFLTNTNTPVLSAQTTASYGNIIGFFNRQQLSVGGPQHETKLDTISIAETLEYLTIVNNGNGITLSIPTLHNMSYYVQTSSNLKTWTNYDGPFFGDGNLLQKNYSITNQSQLFYRFSATLPDITSGLVGYYPFNGNANDLSGYTNNGSVFGATLTTNRFGTPNGAYNFTGVGNTYISIPDSPSLDMTNAITLALWFNTKGGGYAQPRILTKGPPSYGIGLSDTSSSPSIFFANESASVSSSPINLVQSGWIFVAGTYDGHSMQIYTNGVLAGQFSISGSIGVSHEPLGIGENLDDSSDFVNGQIDDVRIYNRALTPAEIQQLYITP